ncbi:MAG: glycosyltransferase family 39 protein, partial [Chloroflexota bacterium]
MTCSGCSYENRPFARFCGRCGMALRLAVLCEQCGTPNRPEHVYCDVCGARLASAESGPPRIMPGKAAGSLGRNAALAGSESSADLARPPADAPVATLGDEARRARQVDAPPQPGAELLTADGAPPCPTADTQADQEPGRFQPGGPDLSPRQAQWCSIAGVLLAVAGEAYLQFADPSNRVKAIGLGLLVLGAALFGLGAFASYLPRIRRWSSQDHFDPRELVRSGSPVLATSVGTILFLTLLIRLWTGSTAASDLVLWVMAIAAFGMAVVQKFGTWRPTRDDLLEAGAVALVMGIFIALNARDLNDWYYSAIGDEYAFLSAASGVLADGIRKPFSQDGVYGAHPVLGTLFQAAVMRVAGNNHFGWLMSSVVSAALAIPAMYLVGRAMAGKAVGLIAAALFGFNHYLFAFAHLGYNNVMAPAPTVWAIALFMLSWKRPNIGLLFASGIAAGLGFYTFYSARTTIPIIGLFLILRYGWRENLSWAHWREQVLRFWPMALGFVLAAGPIFAASGTAVITRMFNEVPGGYAQSVTGPPGEKILSNLWLNVPAFFYNTHTAHYISGSLMDPLSAVLAALGLGLAVRWWGQPGVRLILVWAAVAIGVTALLSPHPTTAVTRLLFDIPPLAILGGLAARQVWEHLPQADPEPTQRRVAVGALVGLCVVVLGLNVQRFWFETPKRYHLTQDAVVVGALRSP